MTPRKEISILVFLLIYIILSLILFDPKLFTGGDNAVYIILAESIATGRGYKNIYLPDEPPHTQYPFGFPLLLALPVLLLGKNIIVLKLIIVLFGIGALSFFHFIVKRLFKDWQMIFTLVYLFIPILIIYNHWILTEIPFLFFSLGSLYFLLKYLDEKKPLFFLISSLFAIYSFFIRTAGISLIIGFTLFLMLKKEYKPLSIFILLFLIFFVPWEIRNTRIPDNTGYLNQLLAKNPYQMELGKVTFSDLFVRIWENFLLYTFTIIPKTFLPILNSQLLLILFGLALLVLMIVGFVLKIKHFSIIEAYIIFGIGVLLAWPKVWSSDRFLLPLIPIILIYLFSAFVWIQDKFKLKNFVLVCCIVFIILNMISIIQEAKITLQNNSAYIKGDRYAGYPSDWRRYFEMIEYIKKNLPPQKIIMARKPEFVYLLSGYNSFCYPFTTDLLKVNESIMKADYIILDNFRWTGTTMRYLLPVIQQNLEYYREIYRTKYPEFFLLEVKK